MGLTDDILEVEKLYHQKHINYLEYNEAKANLIQSLRCSARVCSVPALLPQPDRRGAAEDSRVLTIIQKAESRVNALEKTKERCQDKIDLLEEYSFATEERRLVIRDLLRSQKVFVDTDGESKLAELKKEKDDITGLLVSAQNTYSIVLRQASECRGSSGRAPSA